MWKHFHLYLFTVLVDSFGRCAHSRASSGGSGGEKRPNHRLHTRWRMGNDETAWVFNLSQRHIKNVDKKQWKLALSSRFSMITNPSNGGRARKDNSQKKLSVTVTQNQFKLNVYCSVVLLCSNINNNTYLYHENVYQRARWLVFEIDNVARAAESGRGQTRGWGRGGACSSRLLPEQTKDQSAKINAAYRCAVYFLVGVTGLELVNSEWDRLLGDTVAKGVRYLGATVSHRPISGCSAAPRGGAL